MRHARLSASTSSRWMNCPGSVRESEWYPKVSSWYAMEGTAAHLLASTCLTSGHRPAYFLNYTAVVSEDPTGVDRLFKFETEARRYAAGETGTLFTVTQEMIDAVQVYVNEVLRELPARAKRTRHLHVEEYLNLGHVHRDMGGTADVFFLKSRWVMLFDYKHGANVRVEVEDNTQLRIYALGALRRYPSAEGVVMTVVQPRNGDGAIRRTRYTRAELREFETLVMRRAKMTEDPGAPLVVGPWCSFCPHRSNCAELAKGDAHA